MADDYIDNQETQIYGPRCVAAVERALGGPLAEQPAELKRFLAWSAQQLDAATRGVADALHGALATGGAQQDQAASTAAARESARRAIRGLYKHLDACAETGTWDGDPARYLPGGLRGVPLGGHALLAQLDAVRAILQADPSVPSQREILRRLDAAHRELSAQVTEGDARNADARDGLSEQSAVKLEWLRVYRATALAIESALAFAGRPELLPQLVPHLPVATAAPLPTEKPPAPPVTP